MGENRLNRVALLNIHCEIYVIPEVVNDLMAKQHSSYVQPRL